jgi:hypothetical protein
VLEGAERERMVVMSATGDVIVSGKVCRSIRWVGERGLICY